MLYSVDKSEDLSPGHASEIALRHCSEEARQQGARIRRSFCNKEQVVSISKDYC